jgi:SAM-dependent methyltransferase
VSPPWRAAARTSFAYRKLQQAGREHVKATRTTLAAEWEAQIEALVQRAVRGQQAAHPAAAAARRRSRRGQEAREEIATGYDVTTRRSRTRTAGARAEYEQAIGASMFCDRVIAGLEQGADDYAAHAIQDPLDEVKLLGSVPVIAPYFKDCTRVLDVACGNGAGAIAIALTHPTLHVVGLDYAAAQHRDRDRRSRSAPASAIAARSAR